MMYRNLEEDRKTKIEAGAERSDTASCPCQCKATTELAQAPEPAADHTAVDLALYWDYHGEPK